MNLPRNIINYIEDEEDLDLNQLEYIIGCLKNSEPIFLDLNFETNINDIIEFEIIISDYLNKLLKQDINSKILKLFIEIFDTYNNIFIINHGIIPNLFNVYYDVDEKTYNIIRTELIKYFDNYKETYLELKGDENE